MYFRAIMREKPLYFGKQGKTFFFASELKAIRSHPDFVPEVNREALCCYSGTITFQHHFPYKDIKS